MGILELLIIVCTLALLAIFIVIVIKSAKQDNQKTGTYYREHIDDTNESVEENTQTIQQTIPTQQKQQDEKGLNALQVLLCLCRSLTC